MAQEKPASNERWDQSVELLIVGSGNGALTSALCAYEMGVRNILVIEKQTKYGGTSALSGGGVWIPCNRYAMAAGADDNLDAARDYLRHTLPAGVVPEAIIDTYLREGPRMIDFLHERTQVRYATLDHYPDYYSTLPGARHGHRSLEPEPIRRSALGSDGDALIDTHHMMWLFDRIAFTQVEAQLLMGRQPGWTGVALNLVWDYLRDVPWLLKHRRSRRLCTGSAGVARLRLSMRERNMPLWLNTALTRLITDGSGRVIGAEVIRDGEKMRIEARRGVILAAGGFEHNQAMREQYLPQPTSTAWSAGTPGNTGEVMREAMRLGAATAQMNGAWWCSTISVPGEPCPRLSIIEKSLPGNCVVNRKGERIANESQNYMAYQLALFAKHSEHTPSVPSWMIFDARFRAAYFVGPLLTASFKPDYTLPKNYFDSGLLTRADSIAELAQKTGIDIEGLQLTISNMNRYARTGHDEELQRGDTEYDRYYGDPTVKPNPCLAPIEKPPFYAMRIDPGDFGTQGGLVINTDAQVLDTAGNVIEGLYACGNITAATLPTYPGPGSTLGPAMTFGWQAAKHISGWKG